MRLSSEYLDREVWVRGESRVIRILNHRQEVIAAHARAEPGCFATSDAHINAQSAVALSAASSTGLDVLRRKIERRMG